MHSQCWRSVSGLNTNNDIDTNNVNNKCWRSVSGLNTSNDIDASNINSNN